jgi:hypothetical protein
MFNSFWFWWSLYMYVLLMLYIIGSYYEKGKVTKIKKKDYNINVTKSKFVNEVLNWCMNNMDYPTGHKYYPQVKILYYKTKRNRFGDYTSNTRLIRIFINNHISVEELINTVIHEYTHYLDMPFKQNQKEYNRYLKQKGYYDNPFEINARETAEKYTSICLKDMKLKGLISNC